MIANSNRLSTTLPETPVSLTTFLASIRGTAQEVYGHLLSVRNGNDKKTMGEWVRTIDKLKTSSAR